MNVRLVALAVGVTLLGAGNGFCGEVTGKVVGVHDGDSITVLTAENHELKVRLEGIDAPELKQDFGSASKKELSRIVFGRQVRIEESGKDRYGRTLGDVFVGDEWANRSQVKSGMAWVYRKYSEGPRLLEAEAEAKNSRLGLWRDESPVAPWEWRAAKRVTNSAARDARSRATVR